MKRLFFPGRSLWLRALRDEAGTIAIKFALALPAIALVGAGEHALETFGRQWHPILTEALRVRCAPESSSAYRAAMRRRLDVLKYMRMVLSSARSPER